MLITFRVRTTLYGYRHISQSSLEPKPSSHSSFVGVSLGGSALCSCSHPQFVYHLAQNLYLSIDEHPSSYILRLCSSLRSQARALLKTPSPSPIPRLSLQESSYSSKITLMTQEVRPFLAVTPELDGVTECVHSLLMTPDKTAPKVNCGK